VANPTALTIAQAAREAGVPVSTLRYYERAGVLRPTGKSGAGYRLYDEDAVRRIRVVRAAQGIGLSLRAIKKIVHMDPRGACAVVRGLLEERLAEVDAQLAELARVRAALAAELERCRRSGDCCNVLVKLGVEARGRPATPPPRPSKAS
jgi:DNA-binding transcriptional MerR regulator